MAKVTGLYNDWLEKSGLSAGPKELKFGLQAFEAGFKAAKMSESKDTNENFKKIYESCKSLEQE